MSKNILRMTKARWLVAALLCGANLLAEDEPGRGVARMSLLQGDVSVRRGDSGEWVAAAPNAPLVVEDRVLTGVNSQAEVQFDYANIVRLAPNSELRLAELEYRRYSLQVAAGTVMFNVLRNSEADVEVSTPSVAVRPTKRGMYRITVLQDGTTEVTVRSGEVDVFTTQGSERLKSGRTMVARGTASNVEFQVNGAAPKDEFDRWNDRRNDDLERSSSYKYVDSSVYGAEDLDSYGSWVQDAPYGNVWVPRVAAGWSPYQYGRWSWVDYYGWSWVSYDPWGWAPYHYGRWYWGSRGWCWWPGAYRTRHYWSPGLVAWVGFGHGVSVGVGFGRVGWVPLAPYETYHPWYGWNRYRGYGRGGYVDNSVTIVNNYNIRNSYRNSRVMNGVHSVDGGDFARGRFNNITAMRDGDLNRASLVRGELPVTPERGSLRWADREVNGNPQSRDNARFFSRRNPGGATPERVSFDDQRRGVSELSRRTFGDRPGRSEETAGGKPALVDSNGAGRTDGIRRGREGNTEANVQPGGNNSNSDGRGWRRLGESGQQPDATGRDSGNSRRFGEPRNSDSQTTVGNRDAGNTRARESTDRNGWRRFGEPSGNGSRTSESVNRESNDRGFRQRPEQSAPNASPSQSTERNRDSGWRRFENNGGSSSGGFGNRRSESPSPSPRVESQPSPRMERSAPRSEQPRSEPRMERPQRESSPSMDRRRNNDRSDGGTIRMSPPMVRERQQMGSSAERAPRYEGRSSRMESSGGFGGSQRSAPSMGSRGDSGGFGRSSSGGGGGFSGGGRSGGGGGSHGGGGGGGGGRGRNR